MKRIVLILLICLFPEALCFATSADSAARAIAAIKQADSLKKQDSIKKATAAIRPAATAAPAVKQTTDTGNKQGNDCNCCPVVNENLGGGWFLVLSPLILFIIFGLIILVGSRINLKEAMTENELQKIVIKNEKYNTTNLADVKDIPNIAEILPPVIEVSNPDNDGSYRPSISRFVAVITSMLTLVIAVCLTSFFIYQYLRTGCAPDMGNLSVVLIALGAGIAPYAFNKVASAIGNRHTAD